MSDEKNENSKRRQPELGSFTDNTGLVSIAEKLRIASMDAMPKYPFANFAASVAESVQMKSDLLSSIERIKQSVLPPTYLTKALQPALNITALTDLIDLSSVAERIAQQSKAFQFDFLKSASFIKPIHGILPDDDAIRKAIGVTDIARSALISNFDVIKSLTAAANQSIIGLDWNNLGQLIDASTLTKGLIEQSAVNFFDRYSDFVESASTQKEADIEVNPALSKLSSVEYFTGVEVLESITNEEADRKEKVKDHKEEISFESSYIIGFYLPQLDKDFPAMWQGANEVIATKGIEKVRHYTTSVRELFTQIMQSLAPDAEIKKWSANPNDFPNGRPTRNVRLQYIYRHIKDDTLKDFVDADIKMTLALIDIFQKGTHGKVNPFTDLQLLAIRDRVQSTLSYILMTHFSSYE